MSKKLIVFFAPSNNESKYLKTKHNIGRIFLEGLASSLGSSFYKTKNFYLAEYKMTIFKPSTNIPQQTLSKPDQKNQSQAAGHDSLQIQKSQTQEFNIQRDQVQSGQTQSGQIQKIDRLDSKTVFKEATEIDIHLIYNDGYMNLAGESIWNYFDYKNPSQKYSEIEICLCHDDSDIVSGNTKLVVGGSSGGHKGVDSSYKMLSKKTDSAPQSERPNINQSQKSSSQKNSSKRLQSGDQSKIQNLSWPPIRLKIGIRPPENKLKSETFVLKPITDSDQTEASSLVKIFASKIKENQNLDWQKIQNLVNVKK
jgi:peptidyl-tRNA hydrolase